MELQDNNSNSSDDFVSTKTYHSPKFSPYKKSSCKLENSANMPKSIKSFILPKNQTTMECYLRHQGEEKQNESLETSKSFKSNTTESGKKGKNKLKKLDQALIKSVKAMFSEEQWSMALDFLSSMSNFLPPADIVETVVFNLLFDETDSHVARKASSYLMKLLYHFPATSKMKEFYYDALFLKHQGQNTYEFICKPLDCLTSGGCSGDNDLTCDKNCFKLLEYIILVLKANHESTMSLKENCSSSVLNLKKKQRSLICEIFWPSGKETSLTEYVRNLISRINALYGSCDIRKKNTVHSILMDLLQMVAETALYNSNINGVKVVTYSSFEPQPLTEKLLDEIHSACTNIVNDADKLNLFLELLEPMWMKILLAELVMVDLLKFPKRYRKKFSLRKVILTCMFKSTADGLQENVLSLKRFSISGQSKSLDKTKKAKNKFTGETSDLHRACMENKTFTLDELLEVFDPYDPNFQMQDSYGKTPAHYACEYGYSQCVEQWVKQMKIKMAKDPEKFQKEIFAPDNNGQNLLHISIERDYVEITDFLLGYGGLDTLYVKNNNQKTPLDLVRSSRMKEVLDAQFLKRNTEPVLSLIKNSPICDKLMDGNRDVKNLYSVCIFTIFLYYMKYFDLGELLRKPDINNLHKNVTKTIMSKFHHNDDSTISVFCDDVYVLLDFKKIFHCFFEHFFKEDSSETKSKHFDNLKFFVNNIY